ncbi:unnamed protein product [Rhizopus microsporus]
MFTTNERDNTSTTDSNSTSMSDSLSDTSTEDSTNELNTIMSMEERVKSVFELPSNDKLINRFPCYMIRIVTLPGWMYITNQHICFYASLPGKKKGPHKTGYLTKKNHVNSPRSFRYYFELSGHVLSWYESAESKYLPLNSVDLVGVIRIDMYKPKKFGIRLQTDTGRYFLFADSQVSQKEWFDELRKGIFLAQNSGSSIRVALPLANVIAIEKPSVFQFAENIKISISDGDDEREVIKEYYFAFFPNIELAYCHIVDAWKNNPEYKDKMQQHQQQQQQQQPTSPTYSSFLSFDNFLQNISPAALPTVFMNKIIGQHQNEEEPEESLSQASDTTSQQSSVTGRHHRSSSLSTLRQYITHSYLYNRISSSHEGSNPNNAATSSTSSTHLKPQPSKSRHYRATSISSLLSSGHKEKTLSRDHPVGEIWVSSRLSGLLMKHYQVPIGQHKSPYELEQEQAAMNERLDKHFPMLLNAEKVDATFKCSFWRIIPHYGRMYITDRHLCFYANVAVGKQKLVVPWKDVVQVNRMHSKSFHLVYGLTMTVKDMSDKVYFEFSSIELRDYCFYVCSLMINDAFDTSSIYSKESLLKNNHDLDKPQPVKPPLGYEGPPLLSLSSSYTSQIKKQIQQPLHITCLTIGSRGDVQPYLALCKELKKDGHRCRIATHPEYKEWIEQNDIEFRSVGGDPGDLMKLCIDNSFLSVSFIKEGAKFFYSWFEELLVYSYEACQGTDLLIESPSAMVGVHIAEKLEIPYFRSMPFPFSRTGKFPHPFAVQSTAGGRIYNDMTYVMIEMALWAGTARYINRFRRKVLQLPTTTLDRLELDKVPYLYSFSPSVVHPPKDWPDYIHCTGYWFLYSSQMWTPSRELTDFLTVTDSRPIVYIGFGSIIVPDPGETTRTIVDAVLKSNVRAIICKGWSGRHKEDDSGSLLDQYPGTIYHCESVPHEWLFSRIQAVVHHGGAGTTAAGLRAGLPTVIKPFFGDQRFWGQRVEELQIGVCITKLTITALQDALTTVTQNTAMIARAQAIGETIRKVSHIGFIFTCHQHIACITGKWYKECSRMHLSRY